MENPVSISSSRSLERLPTARTTARPSGICRIINDWCQVFSSAALESIKSAFFTHIIHATLDAESLADEVDKWVSESLTIVHFTGFNYNPTSAANALGI
jgi:hypothetical protein